MQDWIKKALGQDDRPRTREERLADGHRARMQHREDEDNRRSWVARAINPRGGDRTVGDQSSVRGTFSGRLESTHAPRGRNFSHNDGTARGEDSNRRHSSNTLYTPESWTFHGRTFHFKQDYALTGDGGPEQGTSRRGTYVGAASRLGDGEPAVIHRGNRHILVVGGDSVNGGDRARAATYISAADARFLQQHKVKQVHVGGPAPQSSM